MKNFMLWALFWVAVGGARSLPYMCLAVRAWRLCRSCTTAHSCAESGSGPPSWASCISLSCLEAPVQWGNGQGACLILAQDLHIINAQCT